MIKNWVKKLEERLEEYEKNSRNKINESPEDIAINCFAFYARYRLRRQHVIKQQAERYYKQNVPDDMPLEALGWLLSVLGDEFKGSPRSPVADEIARYLNNHVTLNDVTGGAFYYR